MTFSSSETMARPPCFHGTDLGVSSKKQVIPILSCTNGTRLANVREHHDTINARSRQRLDFGQHSRVSTMKLEGKNMHMIKIILLAALVAFGTSAQADVGHSHGHASGVGSPGIVADVSRTIEVEMTDNRYNMPDIEVVKGETVRFVIHNGGHLLHEFNIGTPEMHNAHQAEMLEMMQSGAMSSTRMHHGHGQGHMMKHDDPNSVLVNPGERKELIWRFGRELKSLEFACNVPGHYQSGMVGKFQWGHDPRG